MDRAIYEHHLNVSQVVTPVAQKKRVMAGERQDAIKEEITKLLGAGYIREVQYPRWLTNVVMVRKANGKWRMCVDFRSLNQACPKDAYPLPRIDVVVDRTVGYEVMSFLDAFSGYHQIWMAREDEEKTAFITDYGTYCYRVMPFGLKNAGATYQRMIDGVFKNQRGRNLEAYVDDILVKSRTLTEHLDDLRETLGTLRRYNLKLNPAKCTFGAASGKFLGYLVSVRGIEANPDKIAAILNMPPPRRRQKRSKNWRDGSTVWADLSQKLVTGVPLSFDVCATVSLGRQVRSCVHRIEKVSNLGPDVGGTEGRRGLIPLPGSIRYCSLSSTLRQREGSSTPYLLYQSHTPGH
ncbi:RNA-directed DNA polymerase like [Apostasia shenzhenica]|uniref:RNA-directed DNA polymerase like n=1 Tax=Apostasia shenzhenica TaxID=1088818 RepID=A0A2H9ZXB1_9ASPA|nr:RNA-directed DNA polymerase like [Apostasia shenzhenica]